MSCRGYRTESHARYCHSRGSVTLLTPLLPSSSNLVILVHSQSIVRLKQSPSLELTRINVLNASLGLGPTQCPGFGNSEVEAINSERGISAVELRPMADRVQRANSATVFQWTG